MRRWDLSWRQWGEWALQILEINRCENSKLVASLGLVAALAALAIPANGLVLRGGPGRVYSTGSPPLPPTQPPVDVGAVNVGFTTRHVWPCYDGHYSSGWRASLTTAPAVCSRSAMGTTLSVTHGTWSNAPTSHVSVG